MRSISVLFGVSLLALAACGDDEPVVPGTGGAGGAGGATSAGGAGGEGGEPFPVTSSTSSTSSTSTATASTSTTSTTATSTTSSTSTASSSASTGGAGGTGGSDGGAGGATGGAGGTGGSNGGAGGGAPECSADLDCQDDSFCNGIEVCQAGACVPGADPCDDGVACTTDACDEDANACLATPDDTKCDASANETCDASLGCRAPKSCTTAGDCDDGLACTLDDCGGDGFCVNIAADDLCSNGIFCDGQERCTATGCQAALDEPCQPDAVACTTEVCVEDTASCAPVPDHGACAEDQACDVAQGCIAGCATDADCDDGRACSVGSCDQVTHACSQTVVDADGDGHLDAECNDIDPTADDCDDSDPNVNPGAVEACNANDDNCDGLVDEGVTLGRTDPEGGSRLATTDGATSLSLAYNQSSKKFGVLWNETSTGLTFSTRLLTLNADGTRAIASPQTVFSTAIGRGLHLIHDGTDFVGAATTGTPVTTPRTTLQRFDDAGAAVGGSMTPGPSGVINPALATLGGKFFLGWTTTSSPQVGAMHLTSDLSADGAAFNVAGTTSHYGVSVVAGADGRYGIAWNSSQGVRRFAVYKDGALVSPVRTLGTNKIEASDFYQAANQQVAWTGSEWAVVWQQVTQESDAGDDEYQIYLARLSADGSALLAKKQLTESITGGANDTNAASTGQTLPSVVWSGDSFVVSWAQDDEGLMVLRTTLAGDPIGAPMVLAANGDPDEPMFMADDSAPSLVWIGSEVAVLWYNGSLSSNADAGIYFTRLTCTP